LILFARKFIVFGVYYILLQLLNHKKISKMEDSVKRDNREDVFSEVVRAGKRTYFFDVKETRAGEKYLTITESKRRFNNDTGKFYYEKHKIFLYKEDFGKFDDALKTVLDFIETGIKPEVKEEEPDSKDKSDFSFEDMNEEESKTADDSNISSDDEPKSE
jgi:phosphomannomutase